MANVQAANAASVPGVTNTLGKAARSQSRRDSFSDVLSRAKSDPEPAAKEQREAKGAVEGQTPVAKKNGARKAASTNGRDKAREGDANPATGGTPVAANSEPQAQDPPVDCGNEAAVVAVDQAKALEAGATEVVAQAAEEASAPAVIANVVGDMTEPSVLDQQEQSVAVVIAQDPAAVTEETEDVPAEGMEQKKEERSPGDEAEAVNVQPADAKAAELSQVVQTRAPAAPQGPSEPREPQTTGQNAGSSPQAQAIVQAVDDKPEIHEGQAAEAKPPLLHAEADATAAKPGKAENASPAPATTVQIPIEEPAATRPAVPVPTQTDVGAKAPVSGGTGLPEATPNDAAFAEANHPPIVTAVRGQMLPDGGKMQIRLKPPELGSLQVQVEMRDGVLSASFQTSNDEATRLLSHSLHQLKSALESQGLSVQKLQVEQAPREKPAAQARDEGQGQQQPQDQPNQHEQQRRQMLQRMWRRLRGGRDALDVMG